MRAGIDLGYQWDAWPDAVDVSMHDHGSRAYIAAVPCSVCGRYRESPATPGVWFCSLHHHLVESPGMGCSWGTVDGGAA